MGCLRVKKLNEYLPEALKSALSDSHPYVRKTGVLCVPKLYDVSPELIVNGNFVELLLNLLEKEANVTVVSNIIMSLYELSEAM